MTNKEIKHRLPQLGITQWDIAHRLDISQSFVNQVLQEKKKSKNVIRVALAMIMEKEIDAKKEAEIHG